MSSSPIRRVAPVAVLAVAAVISLSGCRVQSGAAAFVGSHRISESDVGNYLPAVPTAGAGSQLRTSVVGTLVAVEVFRDYLAATPGGVPSDGTLAASRAQAFSVVGGGQVPDDPATLTAAVVGAGLDKSFADIFARNYELEYAVISLAPGTSAQGTVSGPAELATELRKKGPVVRLSPRYGTWDQATLAPTGVTATSLPAFLRTNAFPAATPGGQ